MKEKEQQPIYLKLGIRMALLVLGVCLCLTAAALMAGVKRYEKMQFAANKEIGHDLGRSVALLVDQDNFVSYIKEVKRIYESAPPELRDVATEYEEEGMDENSVEGGEYEALYSSVMTESYLADQDWLIQMANNIGCADIDVCYFDQERERMVFVMTAPNSRYHKELYAAPGYWAHVKEDILDWAKSGDPEDTGFHYSFNFIEIEGAMMASIVPFYDPATREIIAYILVERPVSLMNEDIELFLSGFLLVTGVITILLVALSELVLKFAIMRPLHKYADEQAQIATELGVAQRIQLAMLPGNFPLFPERKEFDLYATMTPAKEVGGDLYDAFLIDDDHLCMVVGDVSGKGVPASLFMAIAKTKLKDRAMAGGLPSEILMDVNSGLSESNKENMFVTVWLGILTIPTGELVTASAGHEYPVIQKGTTGDYEVIKTKNGFVLGAIDGMMYDDVTFQLEKGDAFFMYSDGLPEATNAKGKRLEEEGMIAALNAHKTDGIVELLADVKTEVDAFVGDAPQFDDLTMLVVRYNGAEV